MRSVAYPQSYFNPRTREGCDKLIVHKIKAHGNFNPRTREGCDSPNNRMAPLHKVISIHAPARGATFSGRLLLFCLLYFNPRTREGCDVWILALDQEEETFQSTHPRGVRQIHNMEDVKWTKNFNPRTREGCDPGRHSFFLCATVFQSTHPRGVRLCALCLFNYPLRAFQSTHPRGVRLMPPSLTVCLKVFQSTHPRGVRLPGFSGAIVGLPISIHAPARGATLFLDIVLGFFAISIHAPARGATSGLNLNLWRNNISIHAPARGATRVSLREHLAVFLFQSTHPRGVRRYFRLWAFREDGFQSTHPRGVRPTPTSQCGGNYGISIHAPARGATNLF